MKYLGDSFEAQAVAFLTSRGLKLVEQNFRIKGGEIDLIAWDGNMLVFVEVRARSNARYAGAAESVTPRKQRRIIRTAKAYLQRHRHLANIACRFDVVAFEPPQSDPAIRWIKSAFGE